jgi:hypothetical protein
MLEYGKKNSQTLKVFALMFSMSALSRLISAYYLSKQSEPDKKIPVVLLSFQNILQRILKEEYGKILIFVLIFL